MGWERAGEGPAGRLRGGRSGGGEPAGGAGGARWGPAALSGRGPAARRCVMGGGAGLPSWPLLSGGGRPGWAGARAVGPAAGRRWGGGGGGGRGGGERTPGPSPRGARGSRLIVLPAPPLHSLPVRGRAGPGAAATSMPGVCLEGEKGGGRVCRSGLGVPPVTS